MSARILVVDDEQDLCRLLEFHLGAAGFDVECAFDAQAALACAKAAPPSVAILDVMLPGQSGTALCQTLRSRPETTHTRVVLLTARGSERDRLEGFSRGADDYVVKPFSVQELVMRVRALVRRLDERLSPADAGMLRWRELSLDQRTARVTAEGAVLSLRPLELKLLAVFLAAPGRLFRRGELLDAVWQIRPDTNTRTVDVHVRRLRTSLGAFGDAIETVHGLGYRLKPE